MVALSVSISASTSPAETWSPFFFFHATRVPSVIVSLSLGIWISGMIKKLNSYKGYIVTADPFRSCNFCNSFNRFMRSKPFSRQPRVFRRSEGRRAPSVHCMASGHLLVIRGESAHPAHQKCLFESGNKFLRPPRSTDDLVQQSPLDGSSRWN